MSPMSEPTPRLPPSFLVLPAAAASVLAALGYMPSRSYFGPDGLKAMAAAQGCVLMVIYATMIPGLRRMAAAAGPDRLRVGLAAALLRFLLTMLLAAVIMWRKCVEIPVFLGWLAIAYLVMIQVETWVFIQWSKMLDKHL
jgi:hypothetical protein